MAKKREKMQREDFAQAINFLNELLENARKTKDGQVYIGMHTIAILIRILKDGEEYAQNQK